MENNATPHINIHDALLLDGDPDSIRRYYKKWAATYDADVIDNYFGIRFIAELMHDHIRDDAELSVTASTDVMVMDVGCGTGLLSGVMHELGYTQLDGVDLSEEMIAVARETGLYRKLFAGINLHEPLPETLRGVYDVAVCLGVLTPGHVHPESLYQMAAMTRAGGLLITSTRIPYYDTTDFQQVSDRMEKEGVFTLLKCYRDAPYRDDGDAHYWVYKVH